MKNIITTIAMFILTITTQAQSVYKFDKFYNYKHSSIWESPYAVNNDMDTSLGSNGAECKMSISEQNIQIKNKTLGKTFNYTIVDVESRFDGQYVIYRTKCVEYNNMDVTFSILNENGMKIIYCVWEINFNTVQGWQSVVSK